jgi:NAD(P)-dependent dehydrogenase (short-subunit alcohol dehydrogenase family)
MSAENFRRVMAVNVEGTFNAIQASLPHLKDSKGYFLAVASLAAAMAPPGLAAYGASKRATESLADTFRCEVAHLGVDVGVAYFGWLETDLVREAGEHPAFTYMRTHLAGPMKSVAPLSVAVKAIVKGVVRRKRRILAPGWLRLAMAMRWAIAGDPSAYKKQMPEIERLFAEDKRGRGAYMTDPSNKRRI